jgi:hypothetical protein
VEEDECALEIEASAVIELMIESVEAARVKPGRGKDSRSAIVTKGSKDSLREWPLCFERVEL